MKKRPPVKDTNQSPTDPDALLSLVRRVKENYREPPPTPPKRGKKRNFSSLSFLLLAALAVTRGAFSNSELRVVQERLSRMGPLTEATATRTTVLEGRLL